ncbi:MAG: protein kinase domain-containing protein [Nitrospinota bacterium]
MTENQSNDYPENVGRYRLVKQIAKGGMSKIFLGTDEIIGRQVAIKLTWTLDPSWKNLKPTDIINLFNVEAQISGQLSHYNFVTIYDAGLQGDFGYLVMELIDGKPLSDIIKLNYNSLTVKQKLEILIQLARALYHAHQNGIIHRDIKPSNVILLKNQQVKILDFGVSFVSEGSSVKLGKHAVQLSGVGGTPYYMSPEQINKKKLDGRSDLFSLSVLAYELLTGKRPFVATNIDSLYDKIKNSTPKVVSEVDHSIGENISAVIEHGMEKSLSKRIANCKEFADMLDIILNENYAAGPLKDINSETLSTIKKYRESFEFFFDLDNQQVYELLKVCKVRKYSAGEVIVQENEVARDVYLVMSGKVRIERLASSGKAYTLNTLSRGEVFGEMGIIDGAPRSATAIAETDSLCLTIHQVSLLQCGEATSGKIYKNLATMLSKRLRKTSERFDLLKNQILE